MKHTLPSTINAFEPVLAVPLLVRQCWQRLGLFLGLLSPLVGYGQAPTVITVGKGNAANYHSIGQALGALPSPLTRSYELRLLDDKYNEDLTLNKIGSALNTLTIVPAAGVSTVIAGTFTFGAGSAYTTLNGNNGTTTRSLTLEQVSKTAPALVFSGDASYDVVREAIVLGSNGSLSSGVVVIDNGASTGNGHNTVTQSYVANASPTQLPANLVYAATATGSAVDAFTLSQNELFDFTNTGVLVAAGNGNKWTISGNSIFYNLATAPTTAQTGIDFGAGNTANDVKVTNNFIGGRAAGAAGGIWTNAGTQNLRGIVMNCGSSTTLPNHVSGNTVSNMSLTGGGSAVVLALDMAAGRTELSNNTVTNLANAGTGGVFNLLSRATTVLAPFAIGSGQLMVVESGLAEVQGNLTNLGVINHTGGDILITGNFYNSGSFVQTSGDTEIKGDMLNGGQFTCSTGKVKLTGNGSQEVSGGNYFNLEVNGSGTKTFNGNASIYNGVQMLSGILDTDTYTLSLASLANINETETSYVLGRVDVSRVPAAGASEDFGGVGLVMQLPAGATLPGATKVSRTTGTAPIGVYGREGVLRYFDIVSTTKTSLNVNMTFEYFAHELNRIDPANLRFFRSVNGGSVWQNKGVSSLGPGSAVLNGVNDLSAARWTLGDVTSPLPVGLTAFQAERQGRNAVLTWATASEHGNRGFGIEVSLDGKAFKEISFVEAAGNGNSNSAHSYRFVDAAEGKVGPRYYRLRQEDQNGTAAYFGPHQLNFDTHAASFVAYPTQFAGGLTVSLTSPTASTATLRLLDGMGREVWRQEVGSGVRQVQLACAAGSYVLTATMDGQVLRQRVVKE